MTEALRPGNLVRKIDASAQLDDVCDRFEALWRSGSRPPIEEFLAALPESVVKRGFRALLEVELAYRSKLGETISSDEYRNRFAVHSDVIEDVCPTKSTHAMRLGDYELLEILGRGGMGVVYKARQTRLNRLVAVKILSERGQGQKQPLARFQQEMHAIGRLNHRNIVQPLDAREEDGVHVLVMEYVDGVSLDKLLAAGPLSVANACELIRQAADGLQHAFERGLVHRDIKPSNLILDRAGELKIVDFGLARLSEERLSMGLTNSQQALGTLDFMAPEQFDNASQVDIRADIYSLGCTLFNLLAGCPPFPAPQFSSFASKMCAHCMAPPPMIDELREGIPAALSNVIEKMLAKLPDERFDTPYDVATAVRPFVEGCQLAGLASSLQPTIASPHKPPAARTSDYIKRASTETVGDTQRANLDSTLPSPTPRSTRRRTWLAAAAAAIALVAVGAYLAMNWRFGRSRAEQSQLSIAQVFGTLPGLTGQWWFDEMPWLLPEVRQRWLPYLQGDRLQPPSHEMDSSERIASLDALANDSNVYKLQQQLKLLATERVPGATADELSQRADYQDLRFIGTLWYRQRRLQAVAAGSRFVAAESGDRGHADVSSQPGPAFRRRHSFAGIGLPAPGDEFERRGAIDRRCGCERSWRPRRRVAFGRSRSTMGAVQAGLRTGV